jgi:hypothetical protein
MCKKDIPIQGNVVRFTGVSVRRTVGIQCGILLIPNRCKQSCNGRKEVVHEAHGHFITELTFICDVLSYDRKKFSADVSSA